MRAHLWQLIALLLLVSGCSNAGKTNVDDVLLGDNALCFCSVAADCDDDNPCTVGICGTDCQCTYQPVVVGTACTPVTACLLPGTCEDGVCVSPGNVE